MSYAGTSEYLILDPEELLLASFSVTGESLALH